jgi:hypothetical protein
MSDTAKSVKRLRQIVTLIALTLAFAHLVFPSLNIDAITVTLLGISVVPWLAPLFKSLELPGGWKVEFQEQLRETVERAEQAGLLAPPTAPTAPQAEYAFQRLVNEDPNLALAGLRIEIERRLVRLAAKNGIEVRGRGLSQLLRSLSDRSVLGFQERAILSDLTGLLNAAVHGAEVDRNTAAWAVESGVRLLEKLDERIG